LISKLSPQICIAASLFAAGIVHGARAESLAERWSGPDSQRCAVVNCSSTEPDKPEREYVEPDTSAEDEAAEVEKRYNQINATANQFWAYAQRETSPTMRLRLYARALESFRAQQAISDGAKVRDAIDQIETLHLWTQGVVDNQNADYQSAFTHLAEAMHRRPELFSEGNYNFVSEVNLKLLTTSVNSSMALGDPSVVVPGRVLGDAASERVFYHAPAGVSDRVRKGFQGVATKDWKVARAWFQDALRLDPENADLKSLIAIIDEPSGSDRRITPQHGTTDAFGSGGLPEKFTLRSLKDNADRMTNGQIMSAFEDIMDDYLRTLP
tara:strand:- start:7399 stop:8373 length:975 start_codon:yes stop_codon:yes gene_type:complete